MCHRHKGKRSLFKTLNDNLLKSYAMMEILSAEGSLKLLSLLQELLVVFQQFEVIWFLVSY